MSTTSRTPGGLPLALSEATLVLVHLAVIYGFGRVYVGWSFAAPLAGFALSAHLLAVVTRRARLPLPLVFLIAVAGLGLAASWFVLWPSTTGGLPTGATWHAARDALEAGREQFRTVQAPTHETVGFQLVAGLALWGAAWFSDWAAFRLRATVEAVSPAAVIFVFCTMLGAGNARVASASVFAAAVLAFVAAHRALRAQVDQAWLTASPAVGPRAVLRAGAALAVVALVGGVVAGPRLPGANDQALVSWRDQDRPSGDRTTVSPIVDLRRRLVNQTDLAFFTVQATRPSYWRLTGLDEFDGRLWKIDKKFSGADGSLPSDAPGAQTGQELRQTIEIQNMDDLWVPAAFEPRRLNRSTLRLRWDAESSTLIVDDGDRSTAGLRYQLVSVTPTFTPEQLRAATASDPDHIRENTRLPADFPRPVADQAWAVTAGATTRYDQALALQNWFRSQFQYSLSVPSGHGDDALTTFLRDRVGYCEQFAGAFAAMARSLGIPARVAVGFTPGERRPGSPQTFQVRGRHAHAWPEVWFPGAGWVPFEPTPGRGMPGAENYTGVAPDQDDTTSSPQQTTTSTAPDRTGTTVAPTTTAAVGPTTTAPAVPVRAGTTPPSDGGTSPWTAAGLVALVLAALWLGVVLVAPVLRRRQRGTSPAARVLGAWDDALDPIRWATGLRPRPEETHAEFARRSRTDLGDLADPFTELAGLAEAAAWGTDPVDRGEPGRALSLRDRIGHGLRRRRTPVARAWHRLSLRRALGWA